MYGMITYLFTGLLNVGKVGERECELELKSSVGLRASEDIWAEEILDQSGRKELVEMFA